LSYRLLSKSLKIRTYKTIILPVVLCGSEIWSLSQQERTQLVVFENRLLRRIFGRKREDVAGGWRRQHNEELHNSYASPNIIRVI
jgi:hypothetical protein